MSRLRAGLFYKWKPRRCCSKSDKIYHRIVQAFKTRFENFVSSLYLLIQSSTLKKCIEHCLTALATLLHVKLDLYIFPIDLENLFATYEIWA